MNGGTTGLSGHLALCRASVLYLGSAVPLETAAGIEAFQMPCRERYGSAISADMKVAGIDGTAIAYSSGLLLQYTGDAGNATWFPIQTLHACAALKATTGCIDGRPRFVALDSPEGEASRHPPMFCAIMRRTKGIKVLECHVFICKSTEAAMTMVQAMTHAFEHREGWQPDDAIPPGAGAEYLFGGASGAGGSRLVAANRVLPSNTNNELIQKFAISQSCPPAPAPAPAVQPAPAPAPPPPPAPAPAPVPPPAPVCPPQPAPAPVVMVPVPVQNQYFSNWDAYGGQAMMFIPGSPFCPGPEYLINNKSKKHKKKKKKKKEESDEEEEEVYVMRKSKPAKKKHDVVEYYETRREPPRDYRQVPDDFVVYAPSQQRYYGNDYLLAPDYNFYQGDNGGYPAGATGIDDDYLVAQQYDAEQRAAEAYAAAQYEADLQAAQQYNAALEYNQALAAGFIEPAYPPAGYYGDRYGQLVDGLGYYP